MKKIEFISPFFCLDNQNDFQHQICNNIKENLNKINEIGLSLKKENNGNKLKKQSLFKK
jgi:hypothetical protein